MTKDEDKKILVLATYAGEKWSYETSLPKLSERRATEVNSLIQSVVEKIRHYKVDFSGLNENRYTKAFLLFAQLYYPTAQSYIGQKMCPDGITLIVRQDTREKNILFPAAPDHFKKIESKLLEEFPKTKIGVTEKPCAMIFNCSLI